jgi:hypothetical protein
MGINRTLAPARIVKPHPYPTAAYKSLPNNGNVAPTRDRNRAPAAIADAAYLVNASMKKFCVELNMQIVPTPKKIVPIVKKGGTMKYQL